MARRAIGAAALVLAFADAFVLVLAFALAFAGAARAADDDTPAATTSQALVLRGVELATLIAPGDAAALGIDFGCGFDVSAEHEVLVVAGGRIADALRRAPLLERPHPGIASFARLGKSLVAVANGRLAFVKDGSLVEKVTLPARDMRVLAAAAGDAVYLYGGSEPAARAIFRVRRGGEVEKVMEADAPILAATLGGSDARLFFSAGERVLMWAEGEVPALVYRLPQGVSATALAYDAESNAIFFATADAVFALRGATATLVAHPLSGELRFREGLLFVCDPARRKIVSLAGVAEAIRPKAAAGSGGGAAPAGPTATAAPAGGFKR